MQPPAIDKNILAGLMLEWAKHKEQLTYIEDEIKQTVLALGETTVAGNVRATYNKGKRSWDYKMGVKMFMPEDYALDEAILQRTKTVRTIDWKGICYDENIDKDDIPYTQADPSVTIKVDK